MRRRLLFIGMIVVLFFGVVFIIGTTLKDETRNPLESSTQSSFVPSIPGERGVFTQSHNALKFKDMPASTKNLSSYYSNRAYPGAPPVIPHSVDVEQGIGGKSCLQCHENGGYVAKYNAFAPITPHAEMVNCKQCHVPQRTSSLFKGTDWNRPQANPIHQSALEGSPPVIPHALDLRNNCLSCHGGASAPKEIRVSHPERVNCRQCHVPSNVGGVFERSFFGSDE